MAVVNLNTADVDTLQRELAGIGEAKAKGGKARVAVHPICHRTIHAHFTNAELGRIGENVETLREHPEIAKFLTWIAGKPADFNAPTKKKER